MQRFNIRWLGLLAITLIALYLCWLIVMPFIDVLIWSVVLAVVFYPLFERIHRRLKSKTWSSIATVTLIIVVALIPIAILTTAAVSQVPEGVDAVKGGYEKFKSFLSGDSRLAGLIHQYGDKLFDDKDALQDKLQGYASVVLQRGVNVAGQVLGVLVKIAFTMFALFYLLRDADKIGRATLQLMPLDDAQGRRVFKRCRDVIKASVQGVMVIAAIQGVMGGITFACLGLPSSVLWGFVMFIAAMVPAVGSAIVWAPAAVYLAATGSWVSAIVLVFVGVVVIGSIDNVLRPRLVGSKAGLHDLVIFFSVLGGLQAFGVAGLFVGPVVVALTVAIIEAFKQMNPVGTQANEPKVLVAADGTELLAPD